MDGRASIRWLWLAGARCRRGRASSVPTSSTSCGPTSGRAHTTGRLRIGVGHLKAAGKRNCASRDKVSEPASRRQEQAQRLNSNGPKPANSALVARLQEIPGTVGLDGGPGRTRTSNQTVMSAVTLSEMSMTSGVFHHPNQRMFTIGCGQALAKGWPAVVGRQASGRRTRISLRHVEPPRHWDEGA